MPNWCVNQLHLDGPDSADIIKFMTEPTPLLHHQATRAAVKLFLAGVAAILKPTMPLRFESYPDLVQGIGANTPESQAFTQFVTLISANPLLTDDVCQRVLRLFEQSGLKQRYWGDLPKSARAKISPLLKNSAYDWSGLYFRRLPLDIVWAKLDLPESSSTPVRFSLNALLPPTLLVEINGFNGHLFPRDAGIFSGFNDNCERLGTKWEQVDVDEWDEDKLEFDTAWSPALPPIAELARRYPNTAITHYFVECGCAFSGYVHYVNGDVEEERWDDLQFSEEENKEGYHDLIGPDYVLEHFSHYGG